MAADELGDPGADRGRAASADQPQGDEVALWYHTIDFGSDEHSPGWFDLRGVVDRIPWPDVRGLRCLDIGTYDGFLAFELERRGAREVVCTDIPDHADWDWLPRHRADGPRRLAATAGAKGRGFEVARDRLGSNVHREWINVYDLSPERLGAFDVVVCGALLLHLRDPFKALEAIRSVTKDHFLSIEQVDPIGSLVFPRRPMSRIFGAMGQWTIPNAAGHRHTLQVAGFDVINSTRFVELFGEAHPPLVGHRLRRLPARLAQRVTIGSGAGIPSQAVLTAPVCDIPAMRRDVPNGRG